MLRNAKLAALELLRNAGAFRIVANSRWRRERLLILCYHGISLEDEHEWRPALYMPPQLLEQRLQTLRRLGYSIVPLGDALQRLAARDLPPRSIVITFDDGTYDFYRQGYPLLKKYEIPVTVYQTTYYTDHEIPVFNLICSYMLWKRRGWRFTPSTNLPLTEAMDLRTEVARHRVVRALIEDAERKDLTGREKNEVARRLAENLDIDYEELRRKRILHLMNPRELSEVASNGVDIELHTHRHRTPEDETAFRRELVDNRERIRSIARRDGMHFCYPSGVYRQEFLEWLQKEGVLSATTCDAGLIDRSHNPFLLPRFVDTTGRSQVEFESWLSGVGSLIAIRRTTPQRYILRED